MGSGLRVVVRVDGGRLIGSGHVMRCLVLADALRRAGATVRFVCRAHEGHFGDLIARAGHELLLLPAPNGAQRFSGPPVHASWLGETPERDAAQTLAAIAADGCDLLVVDHYGIDCRWQRVLRPHCRRLFVIDDLADREHDCDFLLDQNLYEDAATRYRDKVPASARCFLGPAFALLREEVRAARGLPRPAPPPWRIVAFFGATDVGQLLPMTVAAARLLTDLPLSFDLVGPLSSSTTLPGNVRWQARAGDFGALMAGSHLALGAPGSATLERMYLGLPSLLVVCADNQREAAGVLQRAGLADVLGTAADMSAARLAAGVRERLADPAALTTMAARLAAQSVGQQTDELFHQLGGINAATHG